MKLVIDANVLFSALIKNSITAELIVNLSFDLYTSDFIIEELNKYKEYLIEKSKKSREEFKKVLNNLLSIITVIPANNILDYRDEAESISPDIKDVLYVALALKLNCPIWSKDKGFKKQTKVRIWNTQELLEDFGD